MARPSIRTALLLVLIGSLTAGPVMAQDIFIRPSTNKPAGPDNTNKPPAPDLGIKTKPAAPAPEPAPQAAAPPPPPQAEYTPPPTPPNIGSQDVTIIPLSEEPPYTPPGEGPNTLHVNLGAGGIGQQDKSSITQSLGLNDQEIQANCYMRQKLVLTYGQSQGESIDFVPGKKINYKFVSPLSVVQIYTDIACRKLRPPVSGMVMELGNYYIVSLASVECPVGNQARAREISLTFRYMGDGTGDCRYQ